MTAFMFRQETRTPEGRTEVFAIALGKDVLDARKSAKLDRSWQRVFSIEVLPHSKASILKQP